MTIKELSLNAHSYQLLPIVISYLVGNNREFDVSDISGGVSLIVGEGELIITKDPSLSAHVTNCFP